MRSFYDGQIAAANVARFRPPVVPGAGTVAGALPADPGEPGHMERLVDAKPRGIWPLRTRWRDIRG